jgi:uncharacterized membrane protein YphA (DoxX/SURF4 family)
MNRSNHKTAVLCLRWILGLYLVYQAAHFAMSAGSPQFVRTGLPHWLPLALGGGELLAAILFLIPMASPVGGYALLVTLGAAVIVHVLHGQFDVGNLFLYAAAVVVCMTETL